MKLVETSIEQVGPGRFRLTAILEEGIAASSIEATRSESKVGLGGGPAMVPAVPDRIVHALIQAPDYSLTVAEIQEIVGGNKGTVNRQAWTLANNAPDLQIRLRGWVFSPERGRYSLTAEAIRFLTGGVPERWPANNCRIEFTDPAATCAQQRN